LKALSCCYIKILSFCKQIIYYPLIHSTPRRKGRFSWTKTKSPRIRLFSKVCRKQIIIFYTYQMIGCCANVTGGREALLTNSSFAYNELHMYLLQPIPNKTKTWTICNKTVLKLVALINEIEDFKASLNLLWALNNYPTFIIIRNNTLLTV
jgi:hypothetical protein